MFVRSAILSAIVAKAAASGLIGQSTEIGADTKMGSKLLSKARRLADDDDADDQTWVAGYSLKFSKCHTMITYDAEAAAEDGDNGYQSPIVTQNLVEFKLCPTGSCTYGCSGGAEYVISMADFVDAYTEAKMTEEEYNCEVVRENCDCDDANDDDVCEEECYVAAGLNYCIQAEEEDEFNVQEYLECAAMEVEQAEQDDQYNGDQEQYYQYLYQYEYQGLAYYIGPYCASDGKSIHLGVFKDEGCTTAAPANTYKKLHWGTSLPYSKESLVGNNCIDCMEPKDDDDGNNDQDQEDEVKEVCENLYAAAGKCESNLSNLKYPNTASCEFIHDVMPKIETALAANSSSESKSSGGGAKVWAIIFGISTVVLAGLCYHLSTKAQRTNVDLSTDGVAA